MFTNKKINVDSEKRKILEELDLYRKEKRLQIDQELLDYRVDKQKQMHELAIGCTEDTRKYEHTFHSTMEEKRVELAKLESTIDEMNKLVDDRNRAIEIQVKGVMDQLVEKNEEIDRLTQIIHKLIEREEREIVINKK